MCSKTHRPRWPFNPEWPAQSNINKNGDTIMEIQESAVSASSSTLTLNRGCEAVCQSKKNKSLYGDLTETIACLAIAPFTDQQKADCDLCPVAACLDLSLAGLLPGRNPIRIEPGLNMEGNRIATAYFC